MIRSKILLFAVWSLSWALIVSLLSGVVWSAVAQQEQKSCTNGSQCTPLAPPPHLTASTYLGGEFSDSGNAIATDADGFVYVVGLTQSPNFPTSTLSLLPPPHGEDAYIAKFSPDGSQLAYIFWINAADANAPDEAYAIAVDSAGGAYVTGRTRSTDFCNFLGAGTGFDPTYNGNGGDHDAFVFKINPAGTAADYCTFLGGSDEDTGQAIAVDEDGRAYIAGDTWSADFPTTPGAIDTTIEARDTFLAQISPAGDVLEYATLVGGSGQDKAVAIALANGTSTVTGWTFSADFPTTPITLDATANGGADGFLYQFNHQTNTLIYSSYLGSAGEDRPTAVAIGPSGAIYLGGYTLAADFPTTPNVPQPAPQPGYEGFIAKLNPTGTAFVYSTLLGGGATGGNSLAQNDRVLGLGVDACGRVTAVGKTGSADFPTTANAYAPTLAGEGDAFIVRLAADGTAWELASYLGGQADDEALGIAWGNGGMVYITGKTNSADFPVLLPAYNATNNGQGDGFMTGFDLAALEVITAAFTAAPTTGQAPLPVHFATSTSGDCLSVVWDFGDGITSTMPITTHLYTIPNTYTATLTVMSGGGPTAVASQPITVWPLATTHTLYLPMVQRP